MMKLSRKRAVAGAPKASSSETAEGENSKKSGQTKISKFFSKALLPSAGSDKSAKGVVAAVAKEEPPKIIVIEDIRFVAHEF